MMPTSCSLQQQQQLKMEEEQQQWIRGSCIGRGSFGTVSLAYDNSGRVFAVKSVPLAQQPFLDSLENEITILKSLHSTYIISYLGDSATSACRNLHLEYVPGGTLADVAGKLTEVQLQHYTKSILRALSYLHSDAGVVHSDVKGQNVLLGPTPGSAKLADFGSARWINSTAARCGGTPLWMAPEVARRGGGVATAKSDIWSLGCTVIEAMTGRCPWWGQNVGMVEIGYGCGVPEFPKGMSKMGRDFLDKCLRRDAEERWTAQELLNHPFVADIEPARGSPRSTLDWAMSEFEEEEEEDDDDDDDDDRMRVIRELGEGGEGVNWSWGEEEGWMVVRSLDESGGVVGCSASSSSSSSTLSMPTTTRELTSCSVTDCCDGKGKMVLNWINGVWGIIMSMIVVVVGGRGGNANPKLYFDWVLRLYVVKSYRFMKLGFLNL